MNTTSSLTIENKLPGHIRKDSLQLNVDNKTAVKSNFFEVLGLKIYREILDIIKSILLIFVIIAVCEATGLHAWWIQLVGGFV